MIFFIFRYCSESVYWCIVSSMKCIPLLTPLLYTRTSGLQGYFMPPSSKKLSGHIGLGLSVRPVRELRELALVQEPLELGS